jgi:response regulator NasT
MTETPLRVLIVDQNVARASVLEEGLREAGYRDLVVVRDMQNLLRRILDEAPDVILIDLENPNRDMLENMFQLSRAVRRPIAMFVDRSDQAAIEAAVDAGVGAYRWTDCARSASGRWSLLHQPLPPSTGCGPELDDASATGETGRSSTGQGILMRERGIEERHLPVAARTAMHEHLRGGRSPGASSPPRDCSSDRRTADRPVDRVHAAARLRASRGGGGEGACHGQRAEPAPGA